MAGGVENLKPGEHKLTLEEQKAGGKASVEARRKKKLLKDNIQLLLSLPIKNNKTKDQLKALGIEEDDMTNQMAMVIAMYQKALKGDVGAFNTLRDTSGEAITNNVKIEQAPIIKDDIPKE